MYEDLNPAQQPALTRGCRQGRKETLPKFYGQNTFIVIDIDEETVPTELLEIMQDWLEIIGPDNVAMLSSLKMALTPSGARLTPQLDFFKRFSDVFVQAGGNAEISVAKVLFERDPECLGPYVEPV